MALISACKPLLDHRMAVSSSTGGTCAVLAPVVPAGARFSSLDCGDAQVVNTARTPTATARTATAYAKIAYARRP